jgi:hypothetical protein
MPTIINGTTGIDQVQDGTITANDIASGVIPTGFGFKNRLINGDCRIDQRNNGASVTPTASAYVLDRYRATMSQASKYSVQQSSVAPTGFVNSLLVTSTSAYSVGTTDQFTVEQYVEGLNLADLGWGTASASTITLSFWVRSSLTGTFGGALKNNAQDRCYPYSFTISAANTWEQKSITIAGDTTGTWLTTNGIGIRVGFNLGTGATYQATAGTWTATNFISAPTGATSVVGTNGATFYITGVQLEKGSTATSFDYRPYGTELALCQRYCVKYGGNTVYEHAGQGNAYSTSAIVFDITLPTAMRTSPSVTASGNWIVQDGNTNTNITSFGIASSGQEGSPLIYAGTAATAGGLTQFRPYFVCANNSLASSLIVSAEL